MRHFFTVDVEEHFQVSAFDDVLPRTDWPRHPSRVERNIELLLDLLAAADTRGTFFVLGCVAEQHPRLIRRIAGAGHEIGSHGQDHRRVTHQSHREFRASVRQTKAVLEDATGTAVRGFRAPSFSIVPGTEWAFDILIEEGHVYDSSLFPIRRSAEYGYASAPRDPHRIERSGGRLWELPLTTLRVGSWSIPAAGGGYFRMLPYDLTHAAFAQRMRCGKPGVFYVHPWEVDPEQPRIAAPWRTRIRHYTGLGRTLDRLRRLLADFRFGSIAEGLPDFEATFDPLHSVQLSVPESVPAR